MRVWTSINGAAWTPQPLNELKASVFPRFRECVHESRNGRAARYQDSYKKLKQQQHAWLYSYACMAFARGHVEFRTRLNALDKKAFECVQFNVVAEPFEVNITYQLKDSTEIHSLSIHSLSPSKQEYRR